MRTCRTASLYRLFALPGTKPPKPGLVRATGEDGGAIEVEVWELTPAAFGSFVAAIPGPLGIGTLELEDGTRVKGFLCEEYATADARDITSFGGWRRLSRRKLNQHANFTRPIQRGLRRSERDRKFRCPGAFRRGR